MSLSRRKFLRAGTLVAISAGIPLKTIVAETLLQPSSFLPSHGGTNTASPLNREAFSGCLNTKFSFSSKEVKAVSVKLVEVYDLTPKTAARTGKECFGVVFAGPRHGLLRQETYSVMHETLGKFDMLVVPIASRKEGFYYEAIFNRLR
jgi:hypothetical protein